MSRRQTVELRVHELLDSAKGEDAFTDLKARLPDDYRKCARQIAALCNSARGDDAFWLVGVNDDRTLSGQDHHDLQNWWPRVRRWFDEVPPDLLDLVIPRPGGTVLALCFSSDRAPFVVKSDGHGVEREVPWRDGTTTRSANRNELLRILAPVRHMPSLELIHADATATNHKGYASGSRTTSAESLEHRCLIQVQAQIFIDAASPITFPVYRQTSRVRPMGSQDWLDLQTGFTASADVFPSMRVAAGALQVAEPCMIRLRSSTDLWLNDERWSELIAVGQMDLEVALSIAGFDRSGHVQASLQLAGQDLDRPLGPYVRWDWTIDNVVDPYQ